MDILDQVMKVIIKVDKNYAKKVAKKESAPEIEAVNPTTISGDVYSVGYSKAEIMPDVDSGRDFWIAGHGSGHKMDGIISPVYVSAMWIDCGNDEGMIWLNADIVGMTRIEINKIRSMIMNSKVIKGCKLINFSATHSHSGIDTLGYWGKPFASIPSDGKDPAYMEMLMNNSLKVAEEAYLNRTKGKLYNGRIHIQDGLHTKRSFKDKHEYLTRLKFVPDNGSNEIWLMNFGGHPNSLGGDNRKLSGEYPYFMREIIAKEKGAEVIFTIGAIGAMDVAYLAEDNLECVKLQGKMIAEESFKIENEYELKPEIKYIQQPFYMQVDNYVLTLLAILKRMSFKAFPCKDSLTGIMMETELTYMLIGDQKFVLLPGENFVSTVYGSYLSAEESPIGKGPEINPTPLCEICTDSNIIAVGNTNDMTGYVVPPNDFILNETQPYLNGTRDKFDVSHYHETNSMGYNAQKSIAETFKSVVERMN